VMKGGVVYKRNGLPLGLNDQSDTPGLSPVTGR
jgi:hypothetical protein